MESITVTLDGTTKPRPENQGDIYYKKERVGTFIRENESISDLTFFDETKNYPLRDLEFIFTTAFTGTPTIEIGFKE